MRDALESQAPHEKHGRELARHFEFVLGGGGQRGRRRLHGAVQQHRLGAHRKAIVARHVEIGRVFAAQRLASVERKQHGAHRLSVAPVAGRD